MAKNKQTRGIANIRESMEIPGVAENPSSTTVAKQLAVRKAKSFALKFMAWGLFPLTFFIVCIMFIDATATKAELPEISSASINNAGGKASAIAEVERWLKSDPAPLPHGILVSWDGFSERHAPDPLKEGDVKPVYIEQVHNFTLRSGDHVYDSQVLVLVDGEQGTKTVESPSLMPRPVESTSDWAGEVPWFGYRSNSPGDAVATAIEAWADAYISGSPKLLKQVTGDGAEDRSYVPLTGVKSVKVMVVTTAVEAPKTLAEDETWEEPDTLLARIEMQVQWIGQPTLKPGDNTQNVSFDLLVTDTHSANAKVVSWGGTGSGPKLKPYSVALEGVKLKEPTDKTNTAETDDSGSTGKTSAVKSDTEADKKAKDN